MPVVFVTGTDTGVGKTVLTGGIAAVLRAEGINVGIMKPVVAGLVQHDGHAISEDVRFLETAAGIIEELDLIAPYRLSVPAAPQLAAEHDGVTIDRERILQAAHELERRYELLLVEGAGGWLVPITRDYLMRDMATDLGGPVLIVARAGLGTINHTLLTVEAVHQTGLPVLGVILNGRPPEHAPADAADVYAALIVSENPRLIGEHTSAPVLGTLPLVPGVSVEQAATVGLSEAIVANLDLQPFRTLVKA